MPDSKPIERRRHSPEFKAQLIAQCAHPGTSVAQVALSHGVNANLVHKWRREAAGALPPTRQMATPGFISLALNAPPAVAAPDIRLELRRGNTTVSLSWPTVAAGECVNWLRELLR